MRRIINWIRVSWLGSSECECMKPPLNLVAGAKIRLGTDVRYGEASITVCNACRSHWLVYQIEFEGFTQSGRWYRGLLPPFQGTKIEPDDVPAYLESLPWFFVGGPYFGHTGKKGGGRVCLIP